MFILEKKVDLKSIKYIFSLNYRQKRKTDPK